MTTMARFDMQVVRPGIVLEGQGFEGPLMGPENVPAVGGVLVVLALQADGMCRVGSVVCSADLHQAAQRDARHRPTVLDGEAFVYAYRRLTEPEDDASQMRLPMDLLARLERRAESGERFSLGTPVTYIEDDGQWGFDQVMEIDGRVEAAETCGEYIRQHNPFVVGEDVMDALRVARRRGRFQVSLVQA